MMGDFMCRLCLGKGIPLSDIYADVGDMKINDMANICIGVEIHPGDSLPSVICEKCEKKIRKFYTFKQKCIEVEMNLKALLSQPIIEHNIEVSNDKNLHLIISEEQDIEKDQNVSEKNLVPNHKLKFQCEQCGRSYKAKTILERHLMSHSGIKLFPCKLCPKKYTRYEHLKVHMGSHIGFKPYVCEICGSSSTKHQDLIRHMKVHSEERNFACPTCERRFKRSSDISSHMRTHSGIRPFICSICSKTYTSRSGLKKHLFNCGMFSNTQSI